MPKRSFDEAVEIKSPCTESWDEMTGNDKVRFCSHCAKDVTDISTMTRREAMRLVRRSAGRLCLRYRMHPVRRTPVFVARLGNTARRAGIAAGVISASMAMAEVAFAQGGAPPQDPVQAEQALKTGLVGATINGQVTDAAGAVIPFAVVSLANAATYEYRAVNATAEGYYEFRDLAAGSYTLKVEAGGFDAKQFDNLQIGEAETLRRDTRLEVQQLAASVEVKADAEGESFTVGGAIMSTVSYTERNALVAAAMNEDLEEVEDLIRRGAKLNARDRAVDGMSALHAAIETGNIEIMQLLLAHGAKPNIRDMQKRTPLMMMDEDIDKEMIRILLSYGADVKLVDAAKNNVLHHFAEFDEPDIMRFLIEQGADPNARNKAGRTPLMVAAEQDNAEVVRVLLEKGADIRAVTKKRQSAWDLAGGASARSVLETYGLVGVGRP